MSRRREIARRLEALTDIAGIMSAMKGLALMETRILMDFLASQRRMVTGIEAAAADFLAWHGEFANEPVAGHEVYVLVGSEQGFCGDFNEALVARVEALCVESDAPARWVIVGQRLAGRIGDRPHTALSLPGATVADEVPAVLLRLTRELGRLLARDDLAGYGLSTFYHCDANGDIRLRRLLPLRDLPAPAGEHPYPPELNLAAAEFIGGLTRHYLHAVLNEVLYSSLMVGNRQRQAYMERALQKLDEDAARLRLAHDIQRQDEITEEIEVILLSAEMLSGSRSGWQTQTDVHMGTKYPLRPNVANCDRFETGDGRIRSGFVRPYWSKPIRQLHARVSAQRRLRSPPRRQAACPAVFRRPGGRRIAGSASRPRIGRDRCPRTYAIPAIPYT